MKNQFILFLSLFTFISNAQIKFEKSLEDAFSKAKSENKFVFIDYYNSECSICQKVNPLLDTKEIGDFYNQHFVSYKLNTNDDTTEKDKTFLENKGLNIEGVPKFIFFDKDKNFIHYSGVTADNKRILSIGNEAINPNKQLSQTPVLYKNGNRSLNLLYSYSSYALLFNNKPLLNKIANEIFEIYPKDELHTQRSYILLKNAVFSTDNGFFKYWINNLDKLNGFEQGYKEGKEKEQIERIIALDLNNQNKVWTSDDLIELRSYIKLANYSDDVDMLLWEKELYAFTKENKTEKINELLKKLIQQNISEKATLSYILTHHMTTIKDKSNIKYAKSEIKALLTQNQNPKTNEEKEFTDKLKELLK